MNEYTGGLNESRPGTRECLRRRQSGCIQLQWILKKSEHAWPPLQDGPPVQNRHLFRNTLKFLPAAPQGRWHRNHTRNDHGPGTPRKCHHAPFPDTRRPLRFHRGSRRGARQVWKESTSWCNAYKDNKKRQPEPPFSHIYRVTIIRRRAAL